MIWQSTISTLTMIALFFIISSDSRRLSLNCVSDHGSLDTDSILFSFCRIFQFMRSVTNLLLKWRILRYNLSYTQKESSQAFCSSVTQSQLPRMLNAFSLSFRNAFTHESAFTRRIHQTSLSILTTFNWLSLKEFINNALQCSKLSNWLEFTSHLFTLTDKDILDKCSASSFVIALSQGVNNREKKIQKRQQKNSAEALG